MRLRNPIEFGLMDTIFLARSGSYVPGGGAFFLEIYWASPANVILFPLRHLLTSVLS